MHQTDTSMPHVGDVVLETALDLYQLVNTNGFEKMAASDLIMPADAAACCCHARRLPAPSLPPTRFLMATVLMAGTPTVQLVPCQFFRSWHEPCRRRRSTLLRAPLATSHTTRRAAPVQPLRNYTDQPLIPTSLPPDLEGQNGGYVPGYVHGGYVHPF
ncbi:hypothetical protein C8J57DRAFT_1233035 [Mycena rebaudengoi]|nr:hypothetical protein C8J57DRAFT_1233035 [Mycena rebaudengoi]